MDDIKISHCVGLDFETGGKDCKVHGITEVGLVSFRIDNFEKISSFQAYVKPYNKVDIVKRVRKKSDKPVDSLMVYTDEALEYTGLSIELLKEKGLELDNVVESLIAEFEKANLDGSRVSKPILVGHNIQFDIGFLHQIFAFTKNDLSKYLSGKEDFYGNFQPDYFDTLRISRAYYANSNKNTRYNLETLTEELDIDLVAAHTAEDDTYASNEVFQKYLNLMRSGNGQISKTEEVRTRDHFLLG